LDGFFDHGGMENRDVSACSKKIRNLFAGCSDKKN